MINLAESEIRFLALPCLVFVMFASQACGGALQLLDQRTQVDLGVHAVEDGDIATTVPIINRSGTPVCVTYISTTCGCTTATLEPSCLAAGTTAVLNLTMSGKQPGQSRQTVTLITDDAEYRLDVTGVFTSRVHLVEPNRKVQLSPGQAGRVEIALSQTVENGKLPETVTTATVQEGPFVSRDLSSPVAKTHDSELGVTTYEQKLVLETTAPVSNDLAGFHDVIFQMSKGEISVVDDKSTAGIYLQIEVVPLISSNLPSIIVLPGTADAEKVIHLTSQLVPLSEVKVDCDIGEVQIKSTTNSDITMTWRKKINRPLRDAQRGVITFSRAKQDGLKKDNDALLKIPILILPNL